MVGADKSGSIENQRVDNLGIYIGDILIRFFWRRRFTRNFEYE
jgi:hypothetical protein